MGGGCWRREGHSCGGLWFAARVARTSRRVREIFAVHCIVVHHVSVSVDYIVSLGTDGGGDEEEDVRDLDRLECGKGAGGIANEEAESMAVPFHSERRRDVRGARQRGGDARRSATPAASAKHVRNAGRSTSSFMGRTATTLGELREVRRSSRISARRASRICFARSARSALFPTPTPVCAG